MRDLCPDDKEQGVAPMKPYEGNIKVLLKIHQELTPESMDAIMAMVSDHAKAVEAAFREGWECAISDWTGQAGDDWNESKAKALLDKGSDGH